MLSKTFDKKMKKRGYKTDEDRVSYEVGDQMYGIRPINKRTIEVERYLYVDENYNMWDTLYIDATKFINLIDTGRLDEYEMSNRIKYTSETYRR